MIYITQNYFRLPRHTIRENSNFNILFPQDVNNLAHIHTDHCASVISLLEFKQFCHRVWREKHNFITTDLTSTPMDGKYSQPVLFSYWHYIKPSLYSYWQSSWNHSGQSSWKRSGISSLQQNYYHTKRCVR